MEDIREFSLREKINTCTECGEDIRRYDYYYEYGNGIYCEDCFDDILEDLKREQRRYCDEDDEEG